MVTIGLLAAAVFAPIPVFYRYQPGPVRDIEELVSVPGSTTYSSEGSLLMTTVRLDTSVTFLELVIAGIDDTQSVVMRDEVTGGQPLRDLRLQQEAQMTESQRSAKQVAFGRLGLDRPSGNGAKVIATITGSPADGVLKPDDVIIAIDHTRVSTTCEVGSAVGEHQTGDRISVTVKRGDAERSFRLEVVENPFDGSPAFIGVQMETVNFEFETGIDVEFETGKIAGPSAGLMLALGLYDRMTPDDLTAGRVVAGTGTISCDGGVGPIGGIQQKVAGAEAKGAAIFLAPVSNATAARAAARDIEIVPVATFGEAVRYLGTLD